MFEPREQPHILVAWSRDFGPNTISDHKGIAEDNGLCIWGKFSAVAKKGKKIGNRGTLESEPSEVFGKIPGANVDADGHVWRFKSTWPERTLLLMCDPDPRGFTLHHAILHAACVNASAAGLRCEIPSGLSQLVGEFAAVRRIIPDYYFGGHSENQLAFEVRYWFLISDIQAAENASLLAECSHFTADDGDWVPMRFSEPILYPVAIRPRAGKCLEGILGRLRRRPPELPPSILSDVSAKAGSEHHSLWTHSDTEREHRIRPRDLKFASDIPDDEVKGLLEEAVCKRGFRDLRLSRWERHGSTQTQLIIFEDAGKAIRGRIKTPYGWQDFQAFGDT